MKLWIAVDARIADNPKVRALRGRLGGLFELQVETVVGHLINLWGVCYDQLPNGQTSLIDDELLEDWARWRGQRGTFAAAFRELFQDENGFINDWDEWAGPFIQRRERDRLRKRAARHGSHVSGGVSAGLSEGRPVAQDSTQPDSTEPTASSSSSRVNRVEVEGLTESAMQLAIAVNQGMEANPAIGSAFNPIHAGHGSAITLAEALREHNVPLKFAVQQLYDRAKAYKPAGRRRQVTSLTYFTDAVLEAWDAEQARADAATRPHPSKRNGTRHAAAKPTRTLSTAD